MTQNNLPPEQDLKELIKLEHKRAELQRLDSGQEGCGCSDCQKLYKTLDLKKYGSRVKQFGEIVFIAKSGSVEPDDSWANGDQTFVHYGKGYRVAPTGETVCIGPVEAAIAEAESIIMASQKRMRVLCPSFEKCKAPLCPIDNDSLQNGIWYPDENICNARGQKPRWVINQRRVAKRAKRRERYFTFALLQNMRRVVNPRGYDPDKPARTTTRQQKVPFKTRGEKNKGFNKGKTIGGGKQTSLF